eukprot:jgi/Mesen1/5273/ME000263S04378
MASDELPAGTCQGSHLLAEASGGQHAEAGRRQGESERETGGADAGGGGGAGAAAAGGGGGSGGGRGGGFSNHQEGVPESILVSIGQELYRVPVGESRGGHRTVGSVISYVVNRFYDDHPAGAKPVVRKLLHAGVSLSPASAARDVLRGLSDSDRLEAHIEGWSQVSVVERYTAHCRSLRVRINPRVVDSLQASQVSEEKIRVADVALSGEDAKPLLAAVRQCHSLVALDLSHNMLGGCHLHSIAETVEASPERDLGLSLDLHANHL